jgi:hypothetical protein
VTNDQMGPEKFLTAVLERMGTPDDDAIELRQLIVGWVGTAVLERGRHEVKRADGTAEVAVNVAGDNQVKVTAQRGGVVMEMTLDALEARAYVLSANATATAMGYVRYVFDDVMRELDRQHRLLLAGVDPQHPASIGDAGASEFDAGADAHAESYRKGYAAALEEIRKGNEECPHATLPPADSVEPFGFRNCPVCGRRMRAYPASAGGPEWRVAM